MITINKAKYQIHKASGTLERYKGDLVGVLIGKKYSINDQIGLIRQQDTKADEYNAFNAYANECVAKVNAMFADMERVLNDTH